MDNKDNQGSPDRDLMNVSKNYEVEYWSTKFNVSTESLKSAVKAVGNSAIAVETYLKSK